MEEREASWEIKKQQNFRCMFGFYLDIANSVCLYTQVHSRGRLRKDIYSYLFILLGNVFSVNVRCLDIRHWTTQEITVLFVIPITKHRSCWHL